ncbi:molybdopterin-containing oxidoreductase family membrane subunit [Desulfobaculum xiamenense]|uniref:Molybdopterin-containing oxidoreductase family membrane subunit n=1 Tax=Desulfobaculum xiamenense TaxID=995050 RepID=A0A846QLJ0_9BACT|nr:NrfD/PsrC family molybdoenzyme membrane anchor subunit [Desulfobaculum xiamenense]NJB69038.1 molybdopterin-containing oxidoreductase family membrane subunit [Desulfobaculum xiamenense]
MLEKALTGDKRYWSWIGFLLVLIGIGFGAYVVQYQEGLVVTGMSRDVSWAFYIAQLTYLVGVAASGVMLVLPYYLHDYKKFGNLVVFGEFMAIGAIIMCLLFVIVDLGQPQRLFNLLIHPTPNSILFWDAMVLNGYMLLNIIVGWASLEAQKKGVPYAKWVRVLAIVSVPFAFSIHTVTAFLYAGIPGRHFWLTAIMAARFLASAFCAGPAIMLLLLMIVEKVANFKLGKEAVATLAKIITYAMCGNVFFFMLELFTAFYSNIPGHKASIVYLFSGLEGHAEMVPFFWTASVLAILSLCLLIPSRTRNSKPVLIFSLIILVIATWIDKGLGLVVAGFIPNMFEGVTPYTPTGLELTISMGIYAIGALIVTVLWKIAVSVKKAAA